MRQLLINVLLTLAVMNKNNLHSSCLSIHVLTKKTYDHAYFNPNMKDFDAYAFKRPSHGPMQTPMRCFYRLKDSQLNKLSNDL